MPPISFCCVWRLGRPFYFPGNIPRHPHLTMQTEKNQYAKITIWSLIVFGLSFLFTAIIVCWPLCHGICILGCPSRHVTRNVIRFRLRVHVLKVAWLKVILVYLTSAQSTSKTRCTLFYFAKTIWFVSQGKSHLFICTFIWGARSNHRHRNAIYKDSAHQQISWSEDAPDFQQDWHVQLIEQDTLKLSTVIQPPACHTISHQLPIIGRDRGFLSSPTLFAATGQQSTCF
jgi:hypothetical protein